MYREKVAKNAKDGKQVRFEGNSGNNREVLKRDFEGERKVDNLNKQSYEFQQLDFVAPKKRKVKSGTGAEKQVIREKIRKMLLKAGWTIDYKPRKNRDHKDMVYVNPAGTTYWSIINAYEAFKKQDGEEDVPEKLLNKLTRQTMKKRQNDLKLNSRGKIGEDMAMEEAEEDNGKKLSGEVKG